MKQFRTFKSVLPMRNGSQNDVLEAVLQCFAGFMIFVQFFENDDHLQEKNGTPTLKPLTNIFNQVLEKLFQTDKNIILENVDLGFVANFLEDCFDKNEEHCAT